MNAEFRERYKDLIDENTERVRLKLPRDMRNEKPTVTFNGVPLRYAPNGFVNTYCIDKNIL